MCTKYDEQNEVCEIKFIDKYGECYYSNDPYVCKDLCGIENKINAYKAGEIDDRIELYNSCGKNEVIKRYRKLYKMTKKGDIRVIYPGLYYLTTGQKKVRWVWKWIYFDESGELQDLPLREKEGRDDEFGETYATTNNKKANRIYKWCKDIMGKVED